MFNMRRVKCMRFGCSNVIIYALLGNAKEMCTWLYLSLRSH